LQNSFESFANAIRYVRYAPGIQWYSHEHSLCNFYLCYPGSDARYGLERTSPSNPCSLGLLFYVHGSRLGFRCCLRSALDPTEAVFERLFDSPWQIFLLRGGLSLLMGIVRQTVIFMIVAALGRDWMDSRCIGAMGGRSASKSWLGTGSLSGIVINGLPGCHRFWEVLSGASLVRVAGVNTYPGYRCRHPGPDSLGGKLVYQLFHIHSLSFDPPPISCGNESKLVDNIRQPRSRRTVAITVGSRSSDYTVVNFFGADARAAFNSSQKRGIRLASRRGADALQYLPNRADGSILEGLSVAASTVSAKAEQENHQESLALDTLVEPIPLERRLSSV